MAASARDASGWCWRLVSGSARCCPRRSAPIWPLVLLGYDRLVIAGDPEQSRRRWRRVLGPLLGLTVLAGLVRVAVLVLVENPGGAEIIWRYALVEVEVMFRYFSLLLSPADQSIFHQVSEVSWPPAPRMVLALIWLAAWLAHGVEAARDSTAQ